MRIIYRLGMLVSFLFIGPGGCATTPPPPSELTIPVLRAYHRDLVSSIASGAATSEQAHDAYYAKLKAIDPPLPDLDSLKELRARLAGQAATGHLTPDEAAAGLRAGELDLLKRWADMAARYSTEQRAIQQFRDDQEKGLWRQKQIEQGEKVFRDRPRL